MNTSNDPQADEKGRRVTIDLTPAAAREVDRLRGVTGLTTADIFRHAFSLFRIYVDAKAKGEELEVRGVLGEATTRIELPLEIDRNEARSHATKP